MDASEIRGAEFTTVRRGYDPKQVHDVLRDASRELQEARDHQHDLQLRLRRAEERAEMLETPDRTFSEMLVTAQTVVQSVRQEAQQEADGILAAAKDAAAELHDAATVSGMATRREAAEEAQDIITTAHAEAERIVAEAAAQVQGVHDEAEELRIEAQDVLRVAHADAAKLLEDAQRDAEVVRLDAEEARQSARVQLDAALREAVTVREDAQDEARVARNAAMEELESEIKELRAERLTDLDAEEGRLQEQNALLRRQRGDAERALGEIAETTARVLRDVEAYAPLPRLPNR